MERLIPRMIAESKKEQINLEPRLFKPSSDTKPPVTTDASGDLGLFMAEEIGENEKEISLVRQITSEVLNDYGKEYEQKRIQTSAVTLKLNRAFEVLKQQGIELSEQEKQMEIDYYNQKTQFVNEQEVFNMINIAFNNRIKYEKSKEQEEFLGMSM